MSFTRQPLGPNEKPQPEAGEKMYACAHQPNPRTAHVHIAVYETGERAWFFFCPACHIRSLELDADVDGLVRFQSEWPAGADPLPWADPQ